MGDAEVAYVTWSWKIHQLKLNGDAFFIFAEAIKGLVRYIGTEQKRRKKTVTVSNAECIISVFSQLILYSFTVYCFQ